MDAKLHVTIEDMGSVFGTSLLIMFIVDNVIGECTTLSSIQCYHLPDGIIFEKKLFAKIVLNPNIDRKLFILGQ